MDKRIIKYFIVGIILYFGIAMVCYFLGFLDLGSALTLGVGMLAADYVGERIRRKGKEYNNQK